MTIENINVRFFAYFNDDENGIEIKEINNQKFEELANDFHVSYERHSVFANGVRQICLTIDNMYQAIDE
jgi:hypothetical protein